MRRQTGFTLVEMLIVLAIIAVLGAIAFPSYKIQMTEGRRSDAHAALLRMADMEEKWYLQNNAYTANVASLGGALSPERFYTLSAVVAGGTYTLTAVPVATEAQINDIAACQAITLNQAGQKLPAVCWQ